MSLLGMSSAWVSSFVAATPSAYVATGLKRASAQLDASVSDIFLRSC